MHEVKPIFGARSPRIPRFSSANPAANSSPFSIVAVII